MHHYPLLHPHSRAPIFVPPAWFSQIHSPPRSLPITAPWRAHAQRDSPGWQRASTHSALASRIIGARLRRVEALLPASGFVSGFLFLRDAALASGECERVRPQLLGSCCRWAWGPALPGRSRQWVRREGGNETRPAQGSRRAPPVGE